MPSIDVPCGVSACTVNSFMSSAGTNVRPTIRFSGNVSATSAADMPMIHIGCASVHRSDALYQRSSARNSRWCFVSSAPPPVCHVVSQRELSIGVRVKLTIIDTRIANAIVHPKG